MIFQQIEDAEEKNTYLRTKSFAVGRAGRRTEKGLRPVSISKRELANKFTEQTMGITRARKSCAINDQSFDKMLRE